MNEANRLFLTKTIEPLASVGDRDRSAERLPAVLSEQAARRIPIVSLLVLGGIMVGWFMPNLLEGQLDGEFRAFYQWGPPVFVLAASLIVFLVARTAGLSSTTLVSVGLLYEVAVSFGLAFGSYWGAFEGVRADQITGDRVGLSLVAVWMLFFTVLVPARPRHALYALLASGSATPFVFYLQMRTGDAPVLQSVSFFWILIFPYLMVAAIAYIAARIVYRLGQDIRRARELGSYHLEELLGRGGMGEVWRASHQMLARPAAVKLIRRDALGGDPASVEAAIARFEREAQVTAALQSRHTVELYDFGTSEDGTLYYVMELLDGIDLDSLVRRFGPLAPERVVFIVQQACASLAEAHRRGLIHRDIKPANIYLCNRAFEYDFVKVLDFGLAKWHSASQADAGPPLSRAGVIAGTPSFMPPEIVLGADPADGRADIYALGCVAYWLLTGRLVFDEASLTAMMFAHVHKEPERPSSHSALAIPSELDDAILRCLAKDPGDRPQRAEDVAELLARVPGGEPWSSERASSWWETHRPSAAARVN